MAPSSGKRFGPYELLSRIGEGGMGQVWKARDTRLDRIVAVKTSAERFSERFEREARAVAALNHPNICTLYDVGPDYLVMEYIDGAEIKGPLPLDQALKNAIQIAGAIEAAHKKSITHRDLKPANILVAKSGVKVLDFGLAKFETATSGTLTGDMITQAAVKGLTQEGAIVGTLQYMAPEQLQGKPVDSRADIFAFGCVLYEMVTGKRAFDGTNAASIIAGILEREAPSVEGVAPASLDWLLKRCLAKDPEDRWQTARDLRAALERIEVIATEAMNVPRPRRTPVAAWAVTSVLAIAAGALAFLHFREKPVDATVARFTIEPDGGMPVASTPPAVSPDGKQIAFLSVTSGKAQLWVRGVDSLQGRVLEGTDGAGYPFWSPDGKSIGFTAGGKLKRVDADGGPVTTVADNARQGSSWGDGVIVFTQNFSVGLKQVPASGGPVRDATRADPKIVAQRFPHFLPDGKHFIYLASTSTEQARLRIGTVVADGKAPGTDPELPDPVGSFAEYSQGNLVFAKGSSLVARPFDLNRLAFTGEPIVLVDEIHHIATLNSLVFSVSKSGVLVYQAGGNKVQLASFDRAGKRLTTPGEPADIRNARVSPDGKMVAIGEIDSASSNPDVWLVDLLRNVRTRFTFDPAADGTPIWSPDGRTVVFRSRRQSSLGNLYVKPADGSKPEELLLADNLQKDPSSFSRDGKYVAYTATGSGSHGFDILILPDPLMEAAQRSDSSKPFPFLQTDANEKDGQFSPDGHWLAYQSDESGREEVYVTAFPGPGSKRQVSVSGGTVPRWRADGRELLFTTPAGEIMAAEVESKGASFEVGKVAQLFKLPDQALLQDVSADGQTFFVLAPPDGEKPQPLTVVLNWPGTLRR